MGFRYFAFTTIYSFMVEKGLPNLSEGSLEASANYTGYLLGAMLGNMLYLAAMGILDKVPR